MTKYSPLIEHLSQLEGEVWNARFSDIERILGFELPASAYDFREWWGNDVTHGRKWLPSGWKTSEVSISAKTVTFRRNLASAAEGKAVVKLPRARATAPAEFHDWDSALKMDCHVEMEWKPLGKIVIDVQGRLSLPPALAVPAIYRFRIRAVDGTERGYVGEAVNLQRRFRNYRNPGSTQQTSLRINAILVEALRNGAHISASAVFADKAWVDRGNGFESLSLASKAVRCLFENAAIVDGAGSEIESLNRAGSDE